MIYRPNHIFYLTIPSLDAVRALESHILDLRVSINIPYDADKLEYKYNPAEVWVQVDTLRITRDGTLVVGLSAISRIDYQVYDRYELTAQLSNKLSYINAYSDTVELSAAVSYNGALDLLKDIKSSIFLEPYIVIFNYPDGADISGGGKNYELIIGKDMTISFGEKSLELGLNYSTTASSVAEPDAILSINGITPDESGNINIISRTSGLNIDITQYEETIQEDT